MKTAFLYAGQGSQSVGMGKDIYEEFDSFKKLLDSRWVDPNWKNLMFEGPMEELTKTENTQPCMAVFAAGVTEILREKGIEPDVSCGLSLGEYGALYSAGVWDTETYVKLVTFRGARMAEAAEGKVCSMSAILGTDVDIVEKVCKELSGEGFITIANYNCTGQYVICGDEPMVEKAEGRLKEEAKARCMRLKVGGPFHTKYMEPAGVALREKLLETSMNTPKIPVAMNVTGDFLGDGNITELLTAQISNSVRFEDCLKKILESGAERIIEIGPGKALSGFLKKTAKQMGLNPEMITIQTAEDLKAL